MQDLWRVLHLLAAAYWLGGLIVLALVAVTAARTVEVQTFRVLMAKAGRAFAAGAVLAGVVIAVSGVAMAGNHLNSLSDLPGTPWGRTLETKTALAFVVVIAAAGHSSAGRRTSSPSALLVARILSLLILALTLGIFYLAVRLTS
jgi:putative copper export protein